MSASETTKEIFDNIQKKYGVVPNIFKELGERSPAVLKVYANGTAALSESSLSPKALNAVMLAVSELNDCNYCTKAHSAFLRGEGMTEGEISKISKGEPLGEDYLDALIKAARIIHEKQGHLTEKHLTDFGAAGVSKAQLYEIIAAIGLKTISNYINHINKTEVDSVFLPKQ